MGYITIAFTSSLTLLLGLYVICFLQLTCPYEERMCDVLLEELDTVTTWAQRITFLMALILMAR